jgi:hypothetical protein|tara:strand:- start:158 stop:496 length:339 start_codon:yes stop_codon:yes gene_type:complete
MDGDVASTEVYQLHIALREISPAIWRRVLVRSDSTIEDLDETEAQSKLLKALYEFEHYIAANKSFIPNYGDRYRNGERIATGFVESTVNQVISKRFVKKQQMRWTERGAHLL